jgi:hypothetical protein
MLTNVFRKKRKTFRKSKYKGTKMDLDTIDPGLRLLQNKDLGRTQPITDRKPGGPTHVTKVTDKYGSPVSVQQVGQGHVTSSGIWPTQLG